MELNARRVQDLENTNLGSLGYSFGIRATRKGAGVSS